MILYAVDASSADLVDSVVFRGFSTSPHRVTGDPAPPVPVFRKRQFLRADVIFGLEILATVSFLIRRRNGVLEDGWLFIGKLSALDSLILGDSVSGISQAFNITSDAQMR